jgi:hypothetical protein
VCVPLVAVAMLPIPPIRFVVEPARIQASLIEVE